MNKTTHIIVVALAAMLAGCNNQPEPQNLDDEQEYQPKQITYQNYTARDSNQYYVIDIEATLPVPDGDEVLERITNSLLADFDAPASVRNPDPQKVLDRLFQTQQINLKQASQDMLEYIDDNDYFPQLAYHQSVYNVSQNKHFISFLFSGYEYGGGAHGISYAVHRNFDMQTGFPITENDMFSDTASVARMLRTSALRQYMRENNDFEVFSVNAITTNGNFIITPDSLMYHYGSYEIAAYCYGQPILRLHKDDIKPYLRTESCVYKYWFGE